MKVKHGQVLTPKRVRLIFNYNKRHSWLHHWPGTGRGPPYNRWTDNERCGYDTWREGFLREQDGKAKSRHIRRDAGKETADRCVPQEA